MELETKMAQAGLSNEEKKARRKELEKEETRVQKESRRNVTTADFESLTVIGRGAFGEVRLVRRKPGRPNRKHQPYRHRAFVVKPLQPGYAGSETPPCTLIRKLKAA